MTENDALKIIKRDLQIQKDNKALPDGIMATEMAIQAIEEIQQYRAIGAVKELINTQIREKVLNVELESYKEIGTIDDFKALNEEVELYRNLDKTNFSDGYNRAIDEFAGRMSLEISESIIWGMLVNSDKDNSFNDTSDKIVDYVIDTAKKIAEEMRGAE